MDNAGTAARLSGAPLAVLVVDDDAFNREGVRLYLAQAGFQVSEAGDEAGARLMAAHQIFDAAVLDVSIPAVAGQRAYPAQSLGIRLAQHLKRQRPRMGIVLFSAYEDRGQEVLELLEMGVRGIAYKLKGCRPQLLLEAIHAALQGKVVIDAEVTDTRLLARELLKRLSVEERPFVQRALGYIDTLTPREWQIADALAASHSAEGVAEEIGVSLKTVENYISRLYQKLGLDEVPGHLRRSNLLTKTWLVRSLSEGDTAHAP